MLYIDAANAGVSGDMFIAGLLDLGADPEKIDLALKPLAGVLGEFEIIIKKVRRGVYSSTYYRFEFVDRRITYDECRDAIQKAALSQPAKMFALSCFETLTDAESKVHGVDKQSLHFHDAADTISDFVAVSALLDDLSLLDTLVQSSSVNTGMGFFTFHNQRSTLPAPATAEILREKPIFGDREMELTTPTGASILVNLADDFIHGFAKMKVKRIGYGAGQSDMDFPNVLKLYLGEASGRRFNHDEITLLETNIDTATGETMGYLFERLFEEGALDIVVVPCIMKKNRPGHILKVMCNRADAENLIGIIIAETGTLGVRIMPHVHRLTLNRKLIEKTFSHKGQTFKVRFKVASECKGGITVEKAEFEDMRRIAKETGLSLRKVGRMLENLKD
ncbi:MAG TPA: nickel pincer cofactor biosynthesis protein LarC [Euryarchaeota archaeon]|nr:nickel pincer cofactor biosynthesis protein LarC [Euryarchaeota archaeon]